MTKLNWTDHGTYWEAKHEGAKLTVSLPIPHKGYPHYGWQVLAGNYNHIGESDIQAPVVVSDLMIRAETAYAVYLQQEIQKLQSKLQVLNS